MDRSQISWETSFHKYFVLENRDNSFVKNWQALVPCWYADFAVWAVILLFINFIFFFLQQNRPLNSQNVADALQKYNLKKAGIQKALDSLADNGKISFKEYGKQKIYIARQDQFDIPNSEELNQMKEENAKLQEQLEEQRKAISKLEGGIVIFNISIYIL